MTDTPDRLRQTLLNQRYPTHLSPSIQAAQCLRRAKGIAWLSRQAAFLCSEVSYDEINAEALAYTMDALALEIDDALTLMDGWERLELNQAGGGPAGPAPLQAADRRVASGPGPDLAETAGRAP